MSCLPSRRRSAHGDSDSNQVYGECAPGRLDLTIQLLLTHLHRLASLRSLVGPMLARASGNRWPASCPEEKTRRSALCPTSGPATLSSKTTSTATRAPKCTALLRHHLHRACHLFQALALVPTSLKEPRYARPCRLRTPPIAHALPTWAAAVMTSRPFTLKSSNTTQHRSATSQAAKSSPKLRRRQVLLSPDTLPQHLRDATQDHPRRTVSRCRSWFPPSLLPKCLKK